MVNVDSNPEKGQLPPIIQRIQELCSKEQADTENTVRVISPAYEAFKNSYDGRNKELQISNRLKYLTKTAMAQAEKYFNSPTIFPGQNLEFCFYKVITEETFPFLPPHESEALIRASRAETERQKSITRQDNGMSYAIEVPPSKLLHILLWNIRDII